MEPMDISPKSSRIISLAHITKSIEAPKNTSDKKSKIDRSPDALNALFKERETYEKKQKSLLLDPDKRFRELDNLNKKLYTAEKNIQITQCNINTTSNLIKRLQEFHDSEEEVNPTSPTRESHQLRFLKAKLEHLKQNKAAFEELFTSLILEKNEKAYLAKWEPEELSEKLEELSKRIQESVDSIVDYSSDSEPDA